MTKEDYDRQNAKKPAKPTPEEWREQEEAARAWDGMRRTYFEAAQSPYRFEEVMLFPDHRFEAPRGPTVKTADEIKDERRRRDRDATLGFLNAMEGLARA